MMYPHLFLNLTVTPDLLAWIEIARETPARAMDQFALAVDPSGKTRFSPSDPTINGFGPDGYEIRVVFNCSSRNLNLDGLWVLTVYAVNRWMTGSRDILKSSFDPIVFDAVLIHYGVLTENRSDEFKRNLADTVCGGTHLFPSGGIRGGFIAMQDGSIVSVHPTTTALREHRLDEYLFIGADEYRSALGKALMRAQAIPIMPALNVHNTGVERYRLHSGTFAGQGQLQRILTPSLSRTEYPRDEGAQIFGGVLPVDPQIATILGSTITTFEPACGL